MSKTDKDLNHFYLKNKIKKTKSINIFSRAQKSLSDINFLYQTFSHLKFIKKLEKKNLKSKIYELLSKIHIETHTKSSIIFKEGDFSKKFYIIISGKVLILIKNKKKIKNKKRDEKLIQILTPFKKNKNLKNFFFNKNNSLKHTIVGILNEGQSFGEIGVIHNEKRLATIIADEECKLGIITSEEFKKIINLSVLEKVDEKFKYFKDLLGHVCEKNEFLRISAFFQEKNFSKGVSIFKEGELFKSVFIVIKGKVVFKKNFQSLKIDNKNDINYFEKDFVKEAEYIFDNENDEEILSKNSKIKKIEDDHKDKNKNEKKNLKQNLWINVF